jgi:hypothetical protein
MHYPFPLFVALDHLQLILNLPVDTASKYGRAANERIRKGFVMEFSGQTLNGYFAKEDGQGVGSGTELGYRGCSFLPL